MLVGPENSSHLIMLKKLICRAMLQTHELCVFFRDHLSLANWYSRGDREFEKAAAMLFPSEIAERGRTIGCAGC